MDEALEDAADAADPPPAGPEAVITGVVVLLCCCCAPAGADADAPEEAGGEGLEKNECRVRFFAEVEGDSAWTRVPVPGGGLASK
jgi:hypothetical protein